MSIPNSRRPQIEDSCHHAGARTPTRGNTIAIQADRDKDDEDESKPTRDFNYESKFMFSDAVLMVQNRPLHCHRVILSLFSPVFRAMFQNRFLENQTNEVVMCGDSYEDVRELLDFMYAPTGRDMSAEVAERLLPIVHRYQMSSLLELAERSLSCRLTDSTAPTYLELGERFGLKKLRAAAMELCARLDAERLSETLHDLDLSQELHTEILEKRVQILEKYLVDIQNSFTHSCTRVESQMKRVASNHCNEHSRPMTHVRMFMAPESTPNGQITVSTGAGSTEIGNDPNATVDRRTHSRMDVGASILPAAVAMGSVSMRPIGDASRGMMGSQPNLAQPAGASTPAQTTSLQATERNAVCEQCAEQLRSHILELCKRGLHKIPIVMMKNN